MRRRAYLKWTSFGIMFVLGAVFGAMLGAFEDGEIGGRWVALVGVASMVFLLPGTWIYWQSLDELAKEAHKSAWMWGGSIGMLIVALPLAVMLELVRQEQMDFGPLDPEMASVMGFSAGAGLTITGAVAGYVVAWVIYWVRKR